MPEDEHPQDKQEILRTARELGGAGGLFLAKTLLDRMDAQKREIDNKLASVEKSGQTVAESQASSNDRIRELRHSLGRQQNFLRLLLVVLALSFVVLFVFILSMLNAPRTDTDAASTRQYELTQIARGQLDLKTTALAFETKLLGMETSQANAHGTTLANTQGTAQAQQATFSARVDATLIAFRTQVLPNTPTNTPIPKRESPTIPPSPTTPAATGTQPLTSTLEFELLDLETVPSPVTKDAKFSFKFHVRNNTGAAIDFEKFRVIVTKIDSGASLPPIESPGVTVTPGISSDVVVGPFSVAAGRYSAHVDELRRGHDGSTTLRRPSAAKNGGEDFYIFFDVVVPGKP